MATGGSPTNAPRGRDGSKGAAGRHAFVVEVLRGYLGTLWLGQDPDEDAEDRTALVRHVAPIAASGTRMAMVEAARWGRGASGWSDLPILEVIEGKTSIDLVMPAVEAEPLRSLLRTVALRHVPTDPAVLLGIGKAVLDEVAKLHSRALAESSPLGFGGLHPDSVLIGLDGRVHVLDAGIGSAAATREPWRSDPQRLGFSAPEQLESRGVADARTDIFIVGVMLWEAFSGRRLFPGNDAKTVRERLLKGPIARLDATRPSAAATVATPIADLVERALERDRDARFVTAEGMSAVIGALPCADSEAIGKWAAGIAEATVGKRRLALERAFGKGPPILDRASRAPFASMPPASSPRPSIPPVSSPPSEPVPSSDAARETPTVAEAAAPEPAHVTSSHTEAVVAAPAEAARPADAGFTVSRDAPTLAPPPDSEASSGAPSSGTRPATLPDEPVAGVERAGVSDETPEIPESYLLPPVADADGERLTMEIGAVGDEAVEGDARRVSGEQESSPDAAEPPDDVDEAAEEEADEIEALRQQPPPPSKRPPALPPPSKSPEHAADRNEESVFAGMEHGAPSAISIGSASARLTQAPAPDRGRWLRIAATVAALAFGIAVGGWLVARRGTSREAAPTAAKPETALAVPKVAPPEPAPVPEATASAAPSDSATPQVTITSQEPAPSAEPAAAESHAAAATTKPAPGETRATIAEPHAASAETGAGANGKHRPPPSHSVPNAGYKPGGI
jgi:serine/threonine-protein kinase